MSVPADNTMILRVLQTVQASQARLELQVTDLSDKLDRVLSEQYIHRGQIGELRHDTKVVNNRWRDLEVRVRALEEAEDAQPETPI